MNDNWRCLNCKFFEGRQIVTQSYRGITENVYEYGTCMNEIFLKDDNQKGIINIDYGPHSWDDRLQVGIDFGCIHFMEKGKQGWNKKTTIQALKKMEQSENDQT